MKRMLSGIKPTGSLTLGNYIGAIKQFVNYQDEYEMLIFLADLHALTLPIDPNYLRHNCESVLLVYLAAGLNPDKVTIFRQSEVHEHAELGYVLCCNSYMGELSRMTQYKDKTSTLKNESIPTGIFIYPTLMAADILLYSPDYVPVGQDQKQHVELTRDIAIRYNNAHNSQTFKVPDPLLAKQGAKIYSLANPSKKMSKSESDKGTIYLDDDVKVAYKKIMSAVTDSDNTIKYDVENKPGISNLLVILSCLTQKSIVELENTYNGQGYGTFKKAVAEAVCSFLTDLQTKMQQIKESGLLVKVLSDGKNKAQAIAKEMLNRVYNEVGLK